MYNQILEYIKKYDSIVISRHKRPDLDALGSQLGLKSLILDNFANKKVYAIGDMSRRSFLGTMDLVDDKIMKESLLILTDVSVSELLPDINYNDAKEIICIDHHNNGCNIERAVPFYDRNAAAACQIIAAMAFELNLKISINTAMCLYAGIISDTNRFNYSLTSDLFVVAGKLIDTGFDYKSMYNTMYSESIAHLKMRAYFVDQFISEPIGLAYIKSDKSIFDRFPVDLFSISRGMVNVMSNIDGVEIWANFTEDPQTGKVVCEFRSKTISIVEVATKYGGGGHKNACGATIDSFEVADLILEDFRQLLKGA